MRNYFLLNLCKHFLEVRVNIFINSRISFLKCNYTNICFFVTSISLNSLTILELHEHFMQIS
jgi:hypothetical protein